MLEIRGQRVRLSGVKKPESETLCRGGGSLQYRSGANAANELARFIAGRPVSCKACTLIDIGARARLALLAALILGIGWYVQGSGLIGLRIQGASMSEVFGAVVTLGRGTTGLASGMAAA